MLTQLFVSDYFDQVLSQFSQAMVAAIHTSHIHLKLLWDLLSDLASSETRTTHLTAMAYEWCSVVCKNSSNCYGGLHLLFCSLEIGFRHLKPNFGRIEAKLIHTEHHQGLAEAIFESGNSEAIADLLCAWTSDSSSHKPYTSLDICVKYLIDLNLHPFPPRLRKLIIYAIYLMILQKSKQLEIEGFVGLLNNLEISFKDIVRQRWTWAGLLLDTAQSSEGIQHLSLLYWNILVEVTGSFWGKRTYNPQTMISLKEAEEWDKLECWIGVVWMLWPPEKGQTTEEDLGDVTLSLFHQRPGAMQKLEQWMEGWTEDGGQIPESFQQICKQAQDEAAQL